MKKFEYFEKLLFDKIQKKRERSPFQSIKDGDLHVGDFHDMFREARDETSEYFKAEQFKENISPAMSGSCVVCEKCEAPVTNTNEMFCSSCNEPINWNHWDDGDKIRYNHDGIFKPGHYLKGKL